MNKITTVLAATAAAAAVITPAAASAGTAVPASRTPVVMMLRYRNPDRVMAQRRPGRFNLLVGPSEWVQGIHWSQWNDHSARGTGQGYGADAKVWREGRVTITLSHPQSGHGHRYFGRVSLSGGVTYTGWHWVWNDGPGGWLPKGVN